jgi:hypothetical protein
MTRKAILIAIAFLTGLGMAEGQPMSKQSPRGAYAIPYASESNRIELEVVNSTSDPLKDVSVRLDAVPSWLAFEQAEVRLGVLKSGESRSATFAFDLDERAPVGEVTDLRFDVSSATGQLESKTMKIEAEAPTELTLRGNYPNPFNPTTKIAYALPKDGNVRIEVFNPLGQRVARLVDNAQKAGYQETSWNAAGFPSGVYFYSVELRVEDRGKVKLGKMVVVK